MAQAREIVQRHGAMVWASLCRLIGAARMADVEDCFQEVFVAALQADRREAVRNWEAMLRRIATRKGLDLLRARIRQRGRERAGAEFEALPGKELRGETILEQAELAGALRVALAQLTGNEAELFCLRHLEEMSYEEIGRQCGMTAGAVGVALHRVRAKLRGELGAGTNSNQREVRND